MVQAECTEYIGDPCHKTGHHCDWNDPSPRITIDHGADRRTRRDTDADTGVVGDGRDAQSEIPPAGY